MRNKRGQIVKYLVYVLLGLLALGLGLFIAVALSGRGTSAISYIKGLLSFGVG
ncbi:hypothetical protein GOV14_00820 [Candidatus Pacearchaeota archaeon]|nr:hypothetical protein [Candidatus Pacearchaeota archaeon]